MWTVTDVDVCIPGMERMRAQNEILLPVHPDDSAPAGNTIAEQAMDELDATANDLGRADYDTIESALHDYLDGLGFSDIPIPMDPEADEGPLLFVYVARVDG